MLTPVPGLTHLKVLTVPPPLPPKQPDTFSPADTPRSSVAEHLVRTALEVAFGMRPITQISPRKFDRPVRLHLSARLRAARGQSTASGPVRMDTLHLRADGEVFGTAVSGGRAHAFTARVADNRMTSFRVL